MKQQMQCEEVSTRIVQSIRAIQHAQREHLASSELHILVKELSDLHRLYDSECLCGKNG